MIILRAILILVGLLLMGLGAIGVWLAMNSPIQLQPIPAIAFVVGLLLLIGGLVSWA